jgi:diguanylate cyclase (GGDEF)-like protein
MHLDSLTALANRAGFLELALELMTDESEEESPGHKTAVIMADLDNFKQVNDLQGHLAGDEALRRTAKVFLASRSKGIQVVGRYGGEEFVAIARFSSRDELLDTVEWVRASIEHELSEFGSSASIGVAYMEPSDRLESMVDRSDKAMYAAKTNGKNCIFEWTRGAEQATRVGRRNHLRAA